MRLRTGPDFIGDVVTNVVMDEVERRVNRASMAVGAKSSSMWGMRGLAFREGPGERSRLAGLANPDGGVGIRDWVSTNVREGSNPPE